LQDLTGVKKQLTKKYKYPIKRNVCIQYTVRSKEDFNAWCIPANTTFSARGNRFRACVSCHVITDWPEETVKAEVTAV
jgi:hypothetical protein